MRTLLVHTFLIMALIISGCNEKATNEEPQPSPIDSIPPVITNLTHSPEFPTRFDTIILSAHVEDNWSGVDSVEFRYYLTNRYFYLTTQNEADSFYAIRYPLPSGSNMKYYIKATDYAGNIAYTDTFLCNVQRFELNFLPNTDTLSVNEACTLTVWLDGAEGVFSIGTDILFDTTLVAVETAYLAEQNLLDGELLFLYNHIPGGISAGIGKAQTAEDDNVSGRGPLFHVVFTGRAPGTANIEIANSVIRTDDGELAEHIDGFYLSGATFYIF
ncbi:MAG: hypothetical protein GY839_06995 [candidate division Zixibacteria bacterium]|nr:hypothetical protein [candidate division Zixibacteria bacterium]